MTEAAGVLRYRRGVPVFQYRTDATVPPVSVLRFSPKTTPALHPHIHDFPALGYLPRAGLVYVVQAGAVVDIAPERVERTTGINLVDGGVGVFFDPAALGDDGRAPWPAWRSHPLLFPFLHGRSGGLLVLPVPAEQRATWEATIAAIEAELDGRRAGYRQAALAHLTLLLIELTRLAADVVGDLRRSGEPLLAEVFEVIEQRRAEPLSLRDVAQAVGMTPGHLTTLVRRRTGRTVQVWIIERRMTEARRLLTETELPIATIAGQVGVSDPGYFTRQFRRAHGMSPRDWRNQQEPAGSDTPDARP